MNLLVMAWRNVWRNDLRASLARVERTVARLGSHRVMVAPSASLLSKIS